MNWLALIVLIIGVCVIADGLGSAWVKDGQYHNVWFDSERYLRAFAGAVLFVIAVIWMLNLHL